MVGLRRLRAGHVVQGCAQRGPRGTLPGSGSALTGNLGLVLEPDEIPGVEKSLLRYRFMAYLVGVLLVVLICVGLPLKYLGDNETGVLWTAIPHGWLYMLLLITAYDLGRRVQWSWTRLALIGLAGTVPFLSFVAERSATKDVLAKIAAVESVNS
ncbi:MAG: DUF3817 domain-containing protein [Micropruina sp.]|nr:DUF3817 domain-containing protein [Micropruina sp.]